MIHDTPTNRKKASRHLVKGLLLLAIACSTQAEIAFESRLHDRFVFLPRWGGVGSIESTSTVCIRSTDNSNNPSDYQVTTPSPLELVSNGGDALPFTIGIQDLFGSVDTDLTPGAPSPPLTGATDTCTGGDNLQLTYKLSETDLASVSEGLFNEQIDITFANANGDSMTQRFRFFLRIDPWIRLSGLNDVYLGNYSPGQGDLQQSQPVCIYTNADQYEVTASGTGAAGAFELQNSLGSVMPYEVRWQDDGAWSTLTANNRARNQNSGNRCANGVTNAQLEITVRSIDMDAGDAATRYTGTLTILVAPN